MVSKYRKPRQYDNELYPLHHKFQYEMEFDIHATDAQNCTIVPFMYTRNLNAGLVKPDLIEVHPMNANYAIETGGLCNYMSIMDNFSATITISMLKALRITNRVSACKVYIGFYRCAFEDIHTKTDIASATTVDTILHLTKNATDADIMPLYNNTKLSAGTQPLSTVNDAAEAFGDLDLDSSVTHEKVAFNPVTYFNSQQYYTNGKFVKGVLPKLIPITLTEKFPYKNIRIKNIPRECKRGNDYMYYGMLIYIPVAGDIDQYFPSGDVTQVPHVRLAGHVHYLEWNSEHDQTL